VFTGIVEERGRIVDVVRLPDEAARVRIRGPKVTADVRLGDSIAVNGVCLTVSALDNDIFDADVMRETLVRSSLATIGVDSEVNLERAVTASTRLGGHLMQGHVDGTGVIRDRQAAEHWEVVRIGLPSNLARYVVEKGSIAVDGVSLTVVEVGCDGEGDWFSVSLIPTTLAETTLGQREVATTVNLEVDVLAKYVERALAYGLVNPESSKSAEPAGDAQGMKSDDDVDEESR
jgi:riboflavin synthase